jgi:hypothetical protein
MASGALNGTKSGHVIVLAYCRGKYEELANEEIAQACHQAGKRHLLPPGVVPVVALCMDNVLRELDTRIVRDNG